MQEVTAAIQAIWSSGRRVKPSPNGWNTGNAVCCIHNGTGIDTRGRAGIKVNGDGVLSYSCFNCGFKASYRPGGVLSKKMQNLLAWMGADPDDIARLRFAVMRNRVPDLKTSTSVFSGFPETRLPRDSKLVSKDNVGVSAAAFEYAASRSIDLDRYKFYTSPETGNRIIIPFVYRGKNVGYTARLLGRRGLKYVSKNPPGFVFNMDQQKNRIILVTEGPFDAMSIDGVAILGSRISEEQRILLENTGAEIILVPDRNRNGRAMTEQAIELNWQVSFPEWPDGILDTNQAVIKQGKLFTMYNIINSRAPSSLTAKVKSRSWFKV